MSTPQEIWAASGYPIPKILFVYHEGQYMAVIDDSQQFIRFIDRSGQIYVAYNAYCNVPAGSNNVYDCKKVSPILCSPTPGVDYEKDTFVLEKIAPLL